MWSWQIECKCENCHKIHVSCKYLRLSWSSSSKCQRRCSETNHQECHSEHRSLDDISLEINKGLSRGNKYGVNKEAQDHFKVHWMATLPPLKDAKDEDTYRARVTAQGLKRDFFADKIKKQRLIIVSTARLPLDNNSGKTEFPEQRHCGLDARDIGNDSQHHDFETNDERITTCSRLRSHLQPDRNIHHRSNHRNSSTRTHHRGNGWKSSSWNRESWHDDQWQSSSDSQCKEQ